MRKEIILSGMTSAPYDDQAPDGQTSLLSGVEIHNNAVRETQLYGTQYNVGDNELIYVHVTSDNSNIFILKGTDGTIRWKNRDSEGIQDIFNPGENVTIQSVNNTLVFLSENNPIKYALWNSGNYKFLGEVPDLSIRFSLMSQATEGIYYSGQLNRDGRNAVLMTDVNAIINGFVDKFKNYFVYPFYVRAALRTYDGRLIKHSSPVLLFPNSNGIPSILDYSLSNEAGTPINARIIGFYSYLAYIIDTDYSEWTDVITSVDIFVSEQINKMKTYYEGEYDIVNFVDKSRDDNFTLATNLLGESEIKYLRDVHNQTVYVPVLTDKNYDVLTNLYLFYSQPTTSVDPMSTVCIQPDKDVIPNIVQKEKMEDDYNSHNKIFCKSSFVYNKRLSITQILSKVYGSPSLIYIIPFSYNPVGLYTTYLKLEKGSKTYYINCGSSFINENQSLYAFRFIFVPEQRAKQIIFKLTGSSKAYVFDLKFHPFLYGSYYYRESFGMPDMVDFEDPECEDVYDEYPNTIYTSEVSNPYIFPVEGVLSVGSGNVIALASLTKELSPSQFGQYPLVALCSDGNYALKVTSEGLYTEPSLMQSEICSNKNSVTQLKAAVVFTSEKGLMLMDGSEIICISDVLNGPDDKFVNETNGIDINFIEFLKGTKISYDYYQNRLILINPEKDYMYIYNMDSASWSIKKGLDVDKVINSYPFSYLQLSSKSIFMLNSVYQYADNKYDSGIIITRPIKLDTFQLKRINTFSVEGNYTNDLSPSLPVEIYGSNDNKSWYLIGKTTISKNNIGRLRGRYFKFFRFVIKPNMSYTNHITGLIIDFDVKNDNRLR